MAVRTVAAGLLLLVVAVGFAAAAGEETPAGAGRDKSLQCLACHGALGIADNARWPDLAGQSPAYLAAQLRDFRDGRRHDPWMSPMAVDLSNSDIDALADYFGSLPGLEPAVAEPDPVAAACVGCHSERAAAANPMWPYLAGQNEFYLFKQLQDYREGRRANPIMEQLARSLSEQEMERLAVHYAGS